MVMRLKQLAIRVLSAYKTFRNIRVRLATKRNLRPGEINARGWSPRRFVVAPVPKLRTHIPPHSGTCIGAKVIDT